MLLPVEANGWCLRLLYALLSERTPEQSISHRAMPTWFEHCAFVASKPYLAWYVIRVGNDFVGAIYLTHRHEIGVGIFREQQRRGYARAAVLRLMELYPGKFLANVNPKNEASRKLWESLGFNLLQVTYSHE